MLRLSTHRRLDHFFPVAPVSLNHRPLRAQLSNKLSVTASYIPSLAGRYYSSFSGQCDAIN